MEFDEAEKWPEIFKKLRRYLFEHRPRTFIVPTSFGFVFALLCLFLFILAAGSGNNLVYGYVFFIISVALVGTHLTNRNIDKLEFRIQPEGFLFAGEKNILLLKAVNSNMNAAVNLQVLIEGESDALQIQELSGLTENLERISWAPIQRGHHQLPRVRIQSTFPFGLLRAWHICHSGESYLVFPKKEGLKEFPRGSFATSSEDVSGLFKGHSAFESSDSTLRLDWRVSARRQGLFVKRFENQRTQRLSFHWDQTSNLIDFEKRISQLALWVDQAEKQGFEYSLEIRHEKIEMGRGLFHWRRCLEVLAKIEGLEAK